MPKSTPEPVSSGPSKFTLILVAFLGGLIAVSLQPLIITFYAKVGLSTEPIYAQQQPQSAPTIMTTTAIPTSQSTEQTTVATTTTTTTTARMTTTTTVAIPLNDPTVDEEPIVLKNEPLTIKVTPATPTTTTKKPATTEKAKAEKREERAKSEKKKKSEEPPQLIDVTGRNTEIPEEVKNFKATRISKHRLVSLCQFSPF